MSDPNPGGTPRDERHDNYPIQGKNRTDVRWIGTVAEGAAPQLYDEHSNTVYDTEIDEDRELIVTKNPEPLGGRSLGEYLEEIGDKHGWESLSSFAREHLEDENE